ncbi:MAG: hypothetical protein AB7T14_04040 [Candidatus Methylacidiphilaceae bacterium]
MRKTRVRDKRPRIVEGALHEGKPWHVVGLYRNGRRVQKWFATKEEGEAWLEGELRVQEELGKAGERVDPRLLVEAMDAKAILAEANLPLVTLPEVARFYAVRNRKDSVTVQKAVTKLLSAMKDAGRSYQYLVYLKSYLGVFMRSFGSRPLPSIETGELNRWLAGLGKRPVSRNNYRRAVAILFSFAVKHGWIDRNPATATDKATVRGNPPEVFSPEGLASLLAVAESNDPSLVPVLALGAFGGLRMAEIERLDWRMVNGRYVRLEGVTTKTGARRLVDLNDTLAAWLAPYRKPEGPVSPSGLRGRLEKLQEVAGLKDWPRNGLRHSFCSYHLALHQDAAKTALQAGHDARMLFAHYRELVTKEDAETYWSLRPGAAANVVPINRAVGWGVQIKQRMA